MDDEISLPVEIEAEAPILRRCVLCRCLLCQREYSLVDGERTLDELIQKWMRGCLWCQAGADRVLVVRREGA